MSNLPRLALAFGLSLLCAVPACAAPTGEPVDAPDEGPTSTRSDALCVPPSFSGTLQAGSTFLFWQAPVGYTSSCDGNFWTQATLGANTGRATRFFAQADVRVQTDQATCATARMSFNLYGQVAGGWAPIAQLAVTTGTWDPNGNWCRMNLSYGMPIATAKSYGSFMLGTFSNSTGGVYLPINSMGLN